MTTTRARPDLPPRVVPNAAQHGPVAMSNRGMVASAHPLAALTGVNVLARGGNAADAAVAIAAAECVLLPAMCGIGGDAFALFYEGGSGRLTGFNGSGAAPRAASREYFVERGYKNMPTHGLLAPTVPGAVDTYWSLWRRFGSLDWAELWAPAIRFAEEGVPVTERVSWRIAAVESRLASFPTTARIFLPGGHAPAPGDLLVQKDLAESLRQIAAGGADAYYRGEIARRIAAYCRENGGLLTEEDFASHQTQVYEPLRTTYRGYEVYETAPPSQGFIVLEQLNLVEGFDLASMGLLSADSIHTMVEAKKLAFADRLRYFGDPRFVENPIEQVLSKKYAARRCQLIDPMRAQDRVAGAEPGDLGRDTTYFAVVDKDGNAISLIHSVFDSFGSGVVAGDTGITLNNRGSGFFLEEGHPNVVAPGKRTMHTLNCYMICQDGKLWVVGGTPGGDQQPQWNLQMITHLVDYGLNVQRAAEMPRWTSAPGTEPATMNNPFELLVEDRLPLEVRNGLESKGHRLRVVDSWDLKSSVQLIMVDRERGVLLGGTDPRCSGLAIGY